ncbi:MULTISPECIES: 9,9'-di-cis-zeta-carotene desaturase [Prochlorococcus]|uniref:9,9'-di-cis-zeta-carotene desaturase n=1 Tax=Prochlorococcus marinus (strain SARG / CCMP1375 / SS120) TaxID=167539 RepID=Q7VE77_PROMA|nr:MULTISPECIES: 9,9'-di-cis-zeta-carotene desaturase [Prochlorococcus]AAP99182.1 Zeta-carotene desaturase [Prochlorococcus marinus subsp. marinus str. CCMP1375]KGG11549.1 Pro-zeta-carotene desaturase [Prochlorococcus marinus str. LG]KGG18497.1 Pro-zeta-carotene desaturase [Prochlorococcus marinus str. SS2]KGG22770.1 Pro-zeta-carotene desaturase [Prochlorococcus marinus str. SS35]KGG32647.1 Pro-zeta-carotene desaturase [Prochlorococcus marinus str. SS51]
MQVAIVGAGLAGLSAAVDLVDAGHKVDLYEARPFLGGKVGSWEDNEGNHIEMGLHVFFFNYANLFALMDKVGAIDNLLAKEHTHLFVNKGGDVKSLDFRFAIGAPFNGLKAFFTTPQLNWVDKLRNALALGTSPIVQGLIDYDGAMKTIRALDSISFQKWFLSHGGSLNSIKRMWNPIAYALGFIDCEAISARCMLTIFMMFAAKTEASKLNLLKGSPHKWLTKPILEYIEARGGRLHLRHKVKELRFKSIDNPEVTEMIMNSPEGEKVIKADKYLAACDVPGIQNLLPKEWRIFPEFAAIDKLEAVPVATVQLRYDGWVTELKNQAAQKDLETPSGLDNLLYTADADFSCFADLALTSPEDYQKKGLGSLLQCVLTPGDPWIPKSTEEIVAHTDLQVRDLFPSAKNLKLIWSNVVKLTQSLYREAPGMEPFRPNQSTPVSNFFLAGSFTQQDYIDSMEGATMSGHLAASAMLNKAIKLEKNSSVN